jgi:hypothetical protein
MPRPWVHPEEFEDRMLRSQYRIEKESALGEAEIKDQWI